MVSFVHALDRFSCEDMKSSISRPALFVVAALALIVAGDLVNASGDGKHPHHAPRESFPVDDGELLFVHVLYRHGDRTPIDPYPTDPWGNASYWPTGWGQLTTIGEQQHFALGQWLRRRYDTLLGERYSKDRIAVQSTDVDRTLMSALSNLAGMFRPHDDQIWNPDLPWQPIPVHTVPESLDHVLAAKRPCAAYEHALKKYKASDEFVRLQKRFKPLYKYLTEKSGRSINSFTDVLNLNNTLFIEQLYNYTLPDWTHSVYPGGDMAWIAARSFATKTATRQLARLKTGFLLKAILQRFADKVARVLTPDRSAWVYSAHDTTVANLLNTLGLFDIHSPPYTACVMLELRLLASVPHVQVFYRNTTDALAHPEPMHIPHCGPSCPLQRMFELYADVLPGDFDEECRLSMLSMTYQEANLESAMADLILIACILLLLSLVCFVACGAYGRRHTNDRWYLRIDNDAEA